MRLAKQDLSIFDASPVGLLITRSSDGLVLNANERFSSMVGIPREELIGQRTTGQPWGWTDPAERASMLKSLARDGIVKDVRFQMRVPGGDLRRLRVSFSPLRYDRNDCLLTASVDVSDEISTTLALSASEERYRSLINHMPSGLEHCRAIFDGDRVIDYEFLHVNPAHAEVTGLTGLEGRRARTAIPEFIDANQPILDRIGSVARGGPPQRWDQYQPLLDKWLDNSLYSPAPGEFVAVIRDITQRKKAEHEAQEIARKLTAALDAMTDAVFITDINEHVLQSNEPFARFHQLEGQTSLKQPPADYRDLFEVYGPDGVLLSPDQWCVPRALRGETGTSVEQHVRRRDTGDTWVGSHSFAPIRDAAGIIIGSVVAVRDVTQQKRIEEALRNVSLVVDQSAESVIITNLDAEIVYVNEAFVRKFGYARDEVIGRTPAMLRAPKTPPEVYAAIWKAVERDGDWSGELVNVRRDGTEFIDHTVVRAIRHYDGSINYYVAVGEDITERKALERAVLEAADHERGRLGRDLHDGLGQELTGLSLMLSAVSHEAGKSGNESLAASLATLAKAAGDCITSARRISHGLMPLELTRGSLSRALSNLIESTHAAATGIDVTVDVPDESLQGVSPMIAEACYRIVQEALSNALRHSQATRMTIQSRRVFEDRIAVTVADNGVGLCADGNRGMGLKIMQYRAHQLGGAVTVAHAPGGGVVVEAEFPLR